MFCSDLKFKDDMVVPLIFRPATRQDDFDSIVPQESPDFSVTMAVFALETLFWRIVAEKEPCFCGTMINDRSGDPSSKLVNNVFQGASLS